MPDLGKATFTLTTNSKPFNTGLVAAEVAAAKATTGINKNLGGVHAAFTRAGTRAMMFGNRVDSAGKKMQRAGKSTMKAGALVGIGIGFALRSGIKFDQVMSNVRAATQASTKDFKRLRKAALDLGSSTQFSAREVAEAQVEMGKAGFKTAQILAALPGVLDAAAASGESMATVANIMVNSLTGFGMAAKDAQVISDGLAFSANETTASISDFGEALKYVAPVARQAGLSFHETNGALIALAKVGIKGSMAGTALRGMLLDMQAPSNLAASQMKTLGLTFRDAQGNMLPFAQNIDRLKAKLKDMPKSKADKFLRDLFGVQQMAAARQFLEIGGAGLDKFTAQSKKSKGAAEDFAAVLRDNLGGDLERMKGSAETAAIKISDDLTPAIRGVTGEMTKMIDKFNELDPTTRKAISQLIAATAVFLTFAGMLGLVGGTVVRGVALMIKGFSPLFKIVAKLGSAFRAMSFNIQTRLAFMGGPLNALRTLFTSVFSKIGTVLRMFVGVFGWVARGVAVAITAIAAFLSIPVWVVALIVAAVIAAAIAIVVWWDKIKAGTIRAWNAIINFLKSAWSKITAGVSRGVAMISSLWDKLRSLTLSKIAYAFGFVLGYIIGTIAKVLIAIGRFVVNMAVKLATGAVSAAQAFWRGIQALPGLIQSMASRAISAISNMARSIGQWLSNAASNAISAAGRLVSGFIAAVRALPGQAAAVFRAVVAAVVNAVKSLPGKVRSFVAKVPGIVKGIASSARSAAVSVGTAIIDGMVEGVKAAAGKLGSAAKAAAKGALDGAKSALGIASPSKVFRDTVGAMIPAGIAEGIKRNQKTVVGEMAQLVNAIRQTDVKSAISTLGGAFTSAVPVLENFFNKANAGLDKFTLKTIKAEAATIKLLAKGKQGQQLANAYMDAAAALEGMRIQAKAMDSQIKTSQQTVEKLANALQDLQGIQIAGSGKYSDEQFALDQQIKALELQQVDLKINTGADDETPGVMALQLEIDKLRLKAEQANLKESLELDPLRRQWEQTVNPIKELSLADAVFQFNTLTAAHTAEQAQLTTLQTNYESITNAIDAYTTALQAALQAAQDLAQQQQAAAATATSNSKRRESLEKQIKNGKLQLAEYNKKGQGQSTAAKKLRNNIALWEKQLAALPKLAKGGIATKPTFAQIGEGNEHEAILPLSKLETTIDSGARRAAAFLSGHASTSAVTDTNDSGAGVTIEKVEMNFHGDVDPFLTSRELTSALKARMGGLV